MVTKSAKETKQFATKFAKNYQKKGGLILLRGELGAGKTTFTQGFCKALGIKDKIISPTFVLVRQHKIKEDKTFFHIDLYRLEKEVNSHEIGLEDMLINPNNIVLIEWPERLKNSPHNSVTLEFKILSPEQRQINVI